MSKIFENIHISSLNDKTYVINENKDGKLKKYVIKTPIMKMPFGVEKYQDKYIINLEFTDKTTDVMKHFYNLLTDIDNYFRSLQGINVDGKFITLKDKSYYSCIKKRPNDYDPLLRTNIKKNKNIIITEIKGRDGGPITLFDLKPNNQIIAFLEINSLWINDDKYGLYYNIKRISLS